MEYEIRKRIKELNSYGFLYTREDINNVKITHVENTKHFMVKSLLAYILAKRYKHKIATEVEIVGVGFADVLDLTTNVQYEIQLKKWTKKNREKFELYKNARIDVIVIDITHFPDDIRGMTKSLKNYIIL